MGSYHNQLDKKYFHKSVYIKKWEEVFNVKIKDYPLQYELVFETYNTLIKFNNILFSKNYIAKSKKVDKMLILLNEYLNTYKNKITKSFDSQCILQYEIFEEFVTELTEMKKLYEEKGKKYNFTIFEKEITPTMFVLEYVYFDWIPDSKGLVYEKKSNDKLPKLINCKLLTELEKHKSISFDYDKQKKLNDEFIKNYFNKTGIDLTQEEKQKQIIFEIHMAIQDLNNMLVNFIIYKDITKLKFYIGCAKNFMAQDFSCLEDIYYKNLIKKLNKILNLICEEQIYIAYDEIQTLIKENNNLYERRS